eukprot:11066028-Alexandrium_andersonii.AAC.1
MRSRPHGLRTSRPGPDGGSNRRWPYPEAEALQGLGVEGPPTGRRGPRAVQTSYKLSAHPRLGHLGGSAAYVSSWAYARR